MKCQITTSGNSDEILRDFMNNIECEGQKLCEKFQMTIVNDIQEIGHF